MATNADQPISVGCELLKTELAAISTTYCQCLPGGQTVPAPAAYPTIGPQPILGYVCLQLDRRAILSNIALRPKTPTDRNSPNHPVAEEEGGPMWAAACQTSRNSGSKNQILK